MPRDPETGDARRDPRYDVLFEPIAIGPVTAKNRFYQVPHCNGMGYQHPTALAWMRGVKAEGGWAVVCTEQVEIHHTSDISPFVELRIWDDRDLPMLARIADRIHEFGALAGIELAYNGPNGPNHYGREVPMGPSAMPVATLTFEPVQARAMTKRDIRDLRRWHRAAALRARKAGFDLVYVYAAHCLSALQYFLSPHHNQRRDEYGGSPRNRVRLLEEILIDTRDAVGDACAVPCRISTDELLGPEGLERAEAEEMIGHVAEIPDLWDVALAAWENDSQTSRFGPEGRQEPFIAGVKRLTTKPVVGVGRYTSPDRMAAVIRKGIADLIGAARPSIADPFLPKKIEEGRLEDIRECIGCNICVSGDMVISPMRCTQNPTMSEEWRKGWHPERIRPRESNRPVLVVGAGPAGLEAAQALGKRGYEVTLAERGKELGGRVARECRLPGPRRVGAGAGLPRAAAPPAPERRGLLRLGPRCGFRPRARPPTGRRRDGRALAKRWRRAPPETPPRHRGGGPGAVPGRRDGRGPVCRARGSGSWSGTTTTTTWAGCSRSCSRSAAARPITSRPPPRLRRGRATPSSNPSSRRGFSRRG